MKLAELYPYWNDTHEDFVETVELLTTAQLRAAPYPRAQNIGDLLVQFLFDERYYTAHLIGGYVLARPIREDLKDGRAIADAMRAAREVTERVLQPYTREGLRAVRTLPADQSINQPETNVTVAWLLWRLLELELIAWGQVRLRRDDSRHE